MGILNLDDVPPPFGAGERPGDQPGRGGDAAGQERATAGPAPMIGEPAIPPHVTGWAPPPQAAAPVQGSPAPSQASPLPPPVPDRSSSSSSSVFDTSALTGPGPAGEAPPEQASAPGTAPPAAAPPIESDPVKTLELKPLIVEQISTVFDPEIPVNIYELGLIYDIAVDGKGVAVIQMTLTAPGCPAAVTLPAEVQGKVKSLEGVSDARVDLVWEPPWDKDRMSDAAKLQLGIFD